MYVQFSAPINTGEITYVVYVEIKLIQHPLSQYKDEVTRACQVFYANFSKCIRQGMHYEFDFGQHLPLSSSEWELFSALFSEHVIKKVNSAGTTTAQILRRV